MITYIRNVENEEIRMLRSITGAALIWVILFCTGICAQDWPRFRGPNATGISPITGINKNWNKNKPALMWKVPLHDQGYAGPSATSEKVFVIDHQGNEDVVLALDIKNGQPVWTFRYPEPGKENYGYARATPLIHEGRVYVVSRKALVHCLDRDSGKLIWKRNLGEDYEAEPLGWGVSASLIVDGGRLIVPIGGKNALVGALNKKTGKTLWVGGGDDQLSYATPVIAHLDRKKQYLIFAANALIGVNPKNGNALWRFPWKTKYKINAAVPIPVGENTVFISSGYHQGCAVIHISNNKPKLVWKNKEIVAHFNSSVLSDGYIYSTGDPGYLICLDPKSGKVMWKSGGFEKGGLCAVDGTLIVISGNTGAIVQIEMTPEKYHELGRLSPIGEAVNNWVAPIVSEKKLIVRNRKLLACLDIAAR